jgi:hypothetical protein
MALADQLRTLYPLQGGDPREQPLLNLGVWVYGNPVSNKGVNRTEKVVMEGGVIAFHKPFAGVDPTYAAAYGHTVDEPPVHECMAWRLASVMGAPWDELVVPAVMRSLNGELGALMADGGGKGGSYDPFSAAPDQVAMVAFWDCLVGQQDRHLGNTRWHASTGRIKLIDHGYSFAHPGDYQGHTVYLLWRWTYGAPGLSGDELAALRQLANSPHILGLAGIEKPGREAALRDRARRMVAAGTLLAPGDF